MSLNSKNKTFLLYDLEITGHHESYILFLIDYFLLHHKKKETLIVISSEKLLERHPIFSQHSNLVFHSIPKDTIKNILESNILTRSIKEWKLYNKMLLKFNATHGLLMYLDIFIFGMALFPKHLALTSGIFFRPSFHYQIEKPTLKQKIQLGLKKILLQKIGKNNLIDNFFVLDESAIPSLAKISNHKKVIFCPDPIESFSITKEDIEAFRTKFNLSTSSKKVFLIFGFLDDRKGILTFLESLQLLEDDELEKIHLIIAGPIAEEYLNIVNQKISSLSKKLEISSFYKKIKGKEIQLFFEISDFIVTLYNKHIGMSSVIIRACISKKAVISDSFGAMGAMVKDNHLGISIDSENKIDISQTVKKALSEGITADSKKQKEISLANSNMVYAKTIFEAM